MYVILLTNLYFCWNSCHKQVRAQLNVHCAAVSQHPLADMLRHGVYRERHSEMVTDSLRALLLEYAGYKVQVFEFIGGEHTSKNVMITAVKGSSSSWSDGDAINGGGGNNSNNNSSNNNKDDILERIQSLAQLHGIRQQKLADWMNVNLIGDEKSDAQQYFPTQMPPV